MKEKTRNLAIEWKKTFKNVDWIFFSVLLISLLAPFIYKFLKIFWISALGADWLADYQVESSFTNLLFETLGIFVIVPVYAFVNRNIKTEGDRKEKYLISFIIGLFSAFMLFILIGGISMPFVNNLLAHGDSSLSPGQQELLFIIIDLGFTMMLINNLLIAYVVLKKKHKQIILITTLSIFIHIFFDFLLISGVVFGEPNLFLVCLTILLTPLINLVILLIVVFAKDFKSWVETAKSLSFKRWKNDLKIYKKTSLFIGIETLIWNIMWFFGVMLPFIIMGNDDPTITTAALLTDALFWVVLSIPLTAATYLQAEHHSHGYQKEQHNEIVKEGFLIAFFVGLSWLVIGPIIIELIYPLMLQNLGADANNAIYWTKHLCWIMFGFYYFMLFARIIYAYWATTGQGFKALIGTIISVLLIWLPSGVLFLTGVIDSPTAVILFYGVGLLVIFMSYFIQWILEFKPDIKLWSWYEKMTKFEEPVIEYDPEVIDEI